MCLGECRTVTAAGSVFVWITRSCSPHLFRRRCQIFKNWLSTVEVAHFTPICMFSRIKIQAQPLVVSHFQFRPNPDAFCNLQCRIVSILFFWGGYCHRFFIATSDENDWRRQRRGWMTKTRAEGHVRLLLWILRSPGRYLRDAQPPTLEDDTKESVCVLEERTSECETEEQGGWIPRLPLFIFSAVTFSPRLRSFPSKATWRLCLPFVWCFFSQWQRSWNWLHVGIRVIEIRSVIGCHFFHHSLIPPVGFQLLLFLFLSFSSN